MFDTFSIMIKYIMYSCTTTGVPRITSTYIDASDLSGYHLPMRRLLSRISASTVPRKKPIIAAIIDTRSVTPRPSSIIL